MEEKEVKEIKSSPKKSSEKFVALVGFETSEGIRYEEGDAVSGLKAIDQEALIEMNAIAKEN